MENQELVIMLKSLVDSQKQVIEKQKQLEKKIEDLEKYINELKNTNFGYYENYQKSQLLDIKVGLGIVLVIFIILNVIKRIL